MNQQVASQRLRALRATTSRRARTSRSRPSVSTQDNQIILDVNQWNRVYQIDIDDANQPFFQFKVCCITGELYPFLTHQFPQSNRDTQEAEMYMVIILIYSPNDAIRDRQKAEATNITLLTFDAHEHMEPNRIDNLALLMVTLEDLKRACVLLENRYHQAEMSSESFFNFNIMEAFDLQWDTFMMQGDEKILLFEHQLQYFASKSAYKFSYREDQGGVEGRTHRNVRHTPRFPIVYDPPLPTSRLAIHIIHSTLMCWRTLNYRVNEGEVLRDDMQVWMDMANYFLLLVEADSPSYFRQHAQSRPRGHNWPPAPEEVANPNQTHRFQANHIRRIDNEIVHFEQEEVISQPSDVTAEFLDEQVVLLSTTLKRSVFDEKKDTTSPESNASSGSKYISADSDPSTMSSAHTDYSDEIIQKQNDRKQVILIETLPTLYKRTSETDINTEREAIKTEADTQPATPAEAKSTRDAEVNVSATPFPSDHDDQIESLMNDMADLEPFVEVSEADMERLTQMDKVQADIVLIKNEMEEKVKLFSEKIFGIMDNVTSEKLLALRKSHKDEHMNARRKLHDQMKELEDIDLELIDTLKYGEIPEDFTESLAATWSAIQSKRRCKP